MRWVALSLTLLLWGLTWPQILPRDADLPPCHMMLLIALSGGWTFVELVRARLARQAATGGKGQFRRESRGSLARLTLGCLFGLIGMTLISAFVPLTIAWERESLEVVDGSARLHSWAFGCDWEDFASIPQIALRVEPFWARFGRGLSWYWLPGKFAIPFSNGRIAYVPFYVLLPFCGLAAWLLRVRKYRLPRCRECGYALTGNESGQCPECGLPTADHAQPLD